jgi:hypothetical protein
MRMYVRGGGCIPSCFVMCRILSSNASEDVQLIDTKWKVQQDAKIYH